MISCKECKTTDRKNFRTGHDKLCIICHTKLCNDYVATHEGAPTHCRKGHVFTPESTTFARQNGKIFRICLICMKRRRDPKYSRAMHIKRKYGLTTAEYDTMLQAQGNVCAACGHAFTYIRKGKAESYHVDHDHKAGTVRGLLCGDCNRALGYLHDDPKRIQGLLEYVLQRQAE
jgi:hypothetical protein